MLKTAQPVVETPTSLKPRICLKGWRRAVSLLGPVSASVCATRSANLVLCPWCFRDQLQALFLVLARCSQGQARSAPMNTSELAMAVSTTAPLSCRFQRITQWKTEGLKAIASLSTWSLGKSHSTRGIEAPNCPCPFCVLTTEMLTVG